MKNRWLACAWAALFAQSALAQATYQVVELPIEPVYDGDVNEGTAFAIGSQGQVLVGVSPTHHARQSASELCHRGHCRVLLPAGRTGTWYDFNEHHALAGEVFKGGVRWAARRDEKGRVQFITPGHATGINASGVTVGQTADGRPFAWDRAGLSILPTLGGASGRAQDINVLWLTVGTSELANGDSHATLWWNGQDGLGWQVFDMGTLPQGRQSSALAINYSWGVAVGCSDGDESTRQKAVRYQGTAGVQELGVLGESPASSACATAINNSNVTVGWSQVLPQPDTHAFVTEGDAMVDLNDRIGPEDQAKYLLLSASAINDAGQIAATAFKLPGFATVVGSPGTELEFAL